MLTSGEILKNKRKELGKTVFEVSQETRIQEKYLKALESNDYSAFDSPVFISGFIKIYSDYLDLDVDKLLALFRRNSQKAAFTTSNKRKVSFSFKNGITTQLITIISIVLILGLALTYILVQYANFQKAPTLEIIKPINGTTVIVPEIDIEGQTDNKSLVFVNNLEIGNSNGKFTTKIKLNEGDNLILIIAKNPKNQEIENRQQISIKYQKPNVLSEQTVNNPKGISVYLIIDKEDTWIQLNIDGKQKIAQVISPQKTQKYTAKESVVIVSGKPTTTKIYIDNVMYPLKINQTSPSRVGSLTCSILSGIVNCEK